MSTDSHKSPVGCGDSTSIARVLRRLFVVGLFAVVEWSVEIGGIFVIDTVRSWIFSSVVHKLLRIFPGRALRRRRPSSHISFEIFYRDSASIYGSVPVAVHYDGRAEESKPDKVRMI
jgi:hypothetical protein